MARILARISFEHLKENSWSIAFRCRIIKELRCKLGRGLGQITIIRKFSVQGTRRDRGAEKRATLGHEDHVSLEKLNRHKESFRVIGNCKRHCDCADEILYFTTGCTWFREGKCSYHGYSGTSGLRLECFRLEMRHRRRKRSKATAFVSII